MMTMTDTNELATEATEFSAIFLSRYTHQARQRLLSLSEACLEVDEVFLLLCGRQVPDLASTVVLAEV